MARLLAAAPQVPDRVVNAAWRDWLVAHDDGLWRLLERWDRASTEYESRRHPLSRLALGVQDTPLPPALLAESAARFDHPVGVAARARLLDGEDPAAVDLFCDLASAAAPAPAGDALAFCVAHQLAPSDEVRRALFFVRTGQREQYRAWTPTAASSASATVPRRPTNGRHCGGR